MTLIETKTLTSTQASIQFTSIPQDGTDLLLLVSTRSDTNTGTKSQYISINGSTSNFTTRVLSGNGSGVSGFTNSVAYIGENTQGGVQANTFSNTSVYLPNYTSSRNKNYIVEATAEANATQAFQQIIAGLWSQTAAITSLTVRSDSDLVSGSSVSLYKITKGSSTVVVS
jgi:hypothetical protein